MDLIARKSWKASYEFWNGIFADPTILADNWLDNYRSIINRTDRFVDLGCGNGNNVKYLLDKGKSVDACDQSPVALENLERRFPEQIESCKLNLIRFNFLERRWPLGVDSYQVVIADMSLHYFLPNDFGVILEKTWSLLKDGTGRLLFRFNSDEDSEFLANLGRQIKPGIIVTEQGMIKHYFSHSRITSAISRRFTIEDLQREHMSRYGKDKIVWRGCARANYKSWYYPLAVSKRDAYPEFDRLNYET